MITNYRQSMTIDVTDKFLRHMVWISNNKKLKEVTDDD